MSTGLTPKILLNHGFVELEEKDVLGRPIYRLSNIKSKYGEYGFDIQVVLNPQYTNSNPNCGIVSLYYPAVLGEEEFIQPIAWHLTTWERLRTIVKSLTLADLEYGRK